MAGLDAGLDLLDHQVLDVDGRLVGKVDDVELGEPSDGPPRMTALLLGPQAYGRHIGSALGRWIERVGARLGGREEPFRVPMEMVDEIGVAVRLSVQVDSLPRARVTEDWFRDNFVARIPGARDAAQ